MLSALSKGHLESSPWLCLKLPLDGAGISKWIILGRDGKYHRGPSPGPSGQCVHYACRLDSPICSSFYILTVLLMKSGSSNSSYLVFL